MSNIKVSNFMISPDKIKTGDNPVTVSFNCEISNASQNPVKITLYILSEFKISFDISNWSETMTGGKKSYTKALKIIAEKIADDEAIKVSIEVKDSEGNTYSDYDSIIYNP